MCITLRCIKGDSEICLFWKNFDCYIAEIFENTTLGDSNNTDVEWFFSEEYRNTIMKLYYRETNPLKILFIEENGIIIGFITYVIYLDEDGKCFILDYGIKPEHRNKGIGRKSYRLLEGIVKNEGTSFLELTSSNQNNINFWESNGFVKTNDMNEHHNYFYRKWL